MKKVFPGVSDGMCEKICVAWEQLGNKINQLGQPFPFSSNKCYFRNFKIFHQQQAVAQDWTYDMDGL